MKHLHSARCLLHHFFLFQKMLIVVRIGHITPSVASVSSTVAQFSDAFPLSTFLFESWTSNCSLAWDSFCKGRCARRLSLSNCTYINEGLSDHRLVSGRFHIDFWFNFQNICCWNIFREPSFPTWAQFQKFTISFSHWDHVGIAFPSTKIYFFCSWAVDF